MRSLLRSGGPVLFGFGLLLAPGCTVGPKLSMPEAAQPESYKGTSTGAEVREAWWTIFNDSTLNGLMDRIDGGNLQLRAALARVDQAYAVLGIEKGAMLPALSGDGSVIRSRLSDNEPAAFNGNYVTQYSAAMGLGWEIDLWGRVRSLVTAAGADAEATAALAADVKLGLQAQLARSYFSLRTLDEEKWVLREAVETREENVKFARDRFEGGVTGELDLARAQTELASTQAQLAQLAGPRTRLENAIAVLVGTAPSEFKLSERRFTRSAPRVRAGVPMETLSARPDVAASQLQLVASNARVGVATATFFPRLDLVGSGGLSSIDSEEFLQWSSRTFAIGPQVTFPIFQGGSLVANLRGTKAAYEETVATYQSTVLEALREVEDALADLAALRAEAVYQADAVKASARSTELSTERYEGGLVSSIEVVDAIREQLNAERRAVQIRGLQFESTVQLIQALGGGLGKKDVK